MNGEARMTNGSNRVQFVIRTSSFVIHSGIRISSFEFLLRSKPRPAPLAELRERRMALPARAADSRVRLQRMTPVVSRRAGDDAKDDRQREEQEDDEQNFIRAEVHAIAHYTHARARCPL